MNHNIAALYTKLSSLLELCVGAILLAAILVGALLLAVDLTGTLISNPRLLDLNQSLGDALSLVVGIEFVKMLVKHTPEAVVEVLLFAIAREMVVVHSGSLETLMGVTAVGIIFLIRKYLSPPVSGEGTMGN